MAGSWAASCSCGWVAVAETLDEAGALVEAHAEQVTKNTTHAITIKGAVDEPRRRRRRPPSGRAPI
jgi:hypothetical protein